MFRGAGAPPVVEMRKPELSLSKGVEMKRRFNGEWEWVTVEDGCGGILRCRNRNGGGSGG